PRWILFHSFFSGHSETPLCSSIILHKGAFCHCPFLLDLFITNPMPFYQHKKPESKADSYSETIAFC
ncbi:hypothetical protein, partial [Anaerotignum sp.]|uniref:hypothetical protein n=1 Tax=Anaerotignum sp. TaxID=2039241 RepID=UPI003A8D44F3